MAVKVENNIFYLESFRKLLKIFRKQYMIKTQSGFLAVFLCQCAKIP